MAVARTCNCPRSTNRNSVLVFSRFYRTLSTSPSGVRAYAGDHAWLARGQRSRANKLRQHLDLFVQRAFALMQVRSNRIIRQRLVVLFRTPVKLAQSGVGVNGTPIHADCTTVQLRRQVVLTQGKRRISL